MPAKNTPYIIAIGLVTILVVGFWGWGKSAEAPATSTDTQVTEGQAAGTPAEGVNSPTLALSPTPIVPGVRPTTPTPKTPAPAPTPTASTGRKAPEIVGGTFFINSMNDPVKMANYKGKKVVLLEFWTYSNINSRRTIPYLNEWYRKYREKGLEIVAVHTPEFDFEKDHTMVKNVSTDYGMAYPIVVDNNGATSKAYGNNNWPHYYLIDIDGNIAYDHVGEGSYETAETIMKKLLRDRAARLGEKTTVDGELAVPAGAIAIDVTKIKTPELYFGASKNTRMGNGAKSTVGMQTLTLPGITLPSTFTLGGTWNWDYQYAETKTDKATFTVHYEAKRVYGVFAAPKPIRVVVTRDGAPLGAAAGKDVTVEKGESVIYVQAGRLYDVVNDAAGYGEHELEFTVDTPGLKVYVIRFG